MRKLARLNLPYTALGAMLMVWFVSVFLKLPIYTDEIVDRMHFSRLFFDGLDAINLMPQCHLPDWRVQLEAFSLPSRIFESLIYLYFDSPFVIKIVGFIFGCLNVLLFTLCLRVFIEDKRLVTIFSLVTFGLGVWPFLYFMNRPEQQMLMGVFLLFLVSKSRNIKFFKNQTAKLFLFLFVVFLFSGFHPKFIFLLPFVYWLSLTSFSSPLYRLVAITTATVVSFFYLMWIQVSSDCPFDTQVNSIVSRIFLSPAGLVKSPMGWINTFFRNLINLSQYVKDSLFQPNYPNGWLPESLNSSFVVFEGIINFVLIALSFALFYLFLTKIFMRTLKVKKNFNSFESGGVFLGFGIVAFIGVDNAKHFYHGSMLFPLVVFSLCLMAKNFCCELMLKYSKLLRLFPYLIASSILLCCIRFSSERTVDGGPFTVENLTPQKYYNQVIKIAKHCGFEDGIGFSAILVDDLTYWAMRRSKLPQNALYVASANWGLGVKNLEDLLRTLGSDGVFVRCKSIRPDLMFKKIEKIGEFCCARFK